MILRSPHPDVTIPETPLTPFVLQGAGEFADKPALIDGPTGRTLTFRQFGRVVRTVAAALAERGFRKGDVFAIFSPNVPEFAVVFHAVSLLGGVNTTINSLFTPDEVAYQLKDSGARFLFTVPPFMDRAAEAAGRTGVEELFVLGQAPGATPFASLLETGGDPPEVRAALLPHLRPARHHEFSPASRRHHRHHASV
jgi:acyl-CoA synthetase (AMP-forming)/AMP-acid ligase II